jgi:hypothetical protein
MAADGNNQPREKFKARPTQSSPIRMPMEPRSWIVASFLDAFAVCLTAPIISGIFQIKQAVINILAASALV